MKIIKLAIRSLAILMVFAGLSIFYGCPGCEFEMPISINSASVRLIDNTGEKPTQSSSEFQPREAIAFRVTLYDTTDYYDYDYYAHSKAKPFSPIQAAYALSCNETYVLQTRLESIRIFALQDLTDEIKTTDEVTDLFVAEIDNYNTSNTLYYTLDKVVDALNSFEFYWQPRISIDFFLTQEPSSSSLSFELHFLLDNGKTLIVPTPNIIVIS